jgi:hypothetical protein
VDLPRIPALARLSIRAKLYLGFGTMLAPRQMAFVVDCLRA